jgi:hypothetical protein
MYAQFSYQVLTELCWVQVRSVLGGLTVSLSHLELFVLVKTFPNLEQGLGQHGVFWLYAGMGSSHLRETRACLSHSVWSALCRVLGILLVSFILVLIPLGFY